MKIGYLLQEGVPNIWQKPHSGPANHVRYVIEEFKRAGHDVYTLARRGNKILYSEDLVDFQPVLIPGMDRGFMKWIEKAVRRLQNELNIPYANFFESLRFAYACKQKLSECDIFFERMGWLGYGSGIASRWLDIPLVLEVNGDLIDEFNSKGLKISKGQQLLSFLLMKRATKKITHVVATGEGWQKKYIDRWDFNPEKISVVENGTTMVDILQRENLKAFKPLKTEAPIKIVFCGGFEAWHGIPILIDAVYSAIEQGCNLQVTLIGSGNEEDKLTDLVKQLGLGKIVTFTGHVFISEVAMYLAQADIGVSPYCGRVEFSGLKLLDYKAAGLAIIASGEGTQPSILNHGKTGWIVPPCDEEALCQAILYLAKDHDTRRKIGQNARIESEKLHRWYNTAQQLLTIFNSVITTQPRIANRLN